MRPCGIAMRRGVIALPRADLAKICRGIVRTRQGLAKPREVTVVLRAVVNVPRLGIVKAPGGGDGARRGRLKPAPVPPYPHMGSRNPLRGMRIPRQVMAILVRISLVSD